MNKGGSEKKTLNAQMSENVEAFTPIKLFDEVVQMIRQEGMQQTHN